MTVMIVDDSAEMRDLLRELVAPFTETVVECANGFECLARYAECQPDWTIMDVRMPRLDGLNAARAMRACWPEAKVLLISHYDSPALVAEAREAGVAACLSKDNLYRVVEFLEKQPESSIPTSSPATPAGA